MLVHLSNTHVKGLQPLVLVVLLSYLLQGIATQIAQRALRADSACFAFRASRVLLSGFQDLLVCHGARLLTCRLSPDLTLGGKVSFFV